MAQKPILYTWGLIVFEVVPLNTNEIHHTTGSDWAKKEIAGAPLYREWVGELDEEVRMSGKIFPYDNARRLKRADMTGIGHLDLMDNMRRLGQAHTLVRGDGWHLGWFIVERLSRGSTFLGPDGIGKQIEFEVTFQRVPVPMDPAAYYPALWSVQGGGQAANGGAGNFGGAAAGAVGRGEDLGGPAGPE